MIAFNARPDGFDNPRSTYLMDDDGGNLRRLTDPHLYVCDRVIWSLDGTRLLVLVLPADDALTGQPCTIAIVDRTTYAVHEIPLSDEYSRPLAWLADGRIIFEDERQYIYSVASDGTGRRRIKELSRQYSDFGWSADRHTMVMIEQIAAGGQICVANADGTGIRPVSDDTWWKALPKLTPDGQQIAFVKHSFDPFSLYMINADGTNRRYLDRISGILPDVGNSDFVWSPDGRQLVYNGFDRGIAENERLPFQMDERDCLCAINADGTNWRILATPTALDIESSGFAPAWSNDGQWVYFVLPEEGAYEHIYRIRPDATDMQQLIGDEHRLNLIGDLVVQPPKGA